MFAMHDHRFLIERVLERYGGAGLFAILLGMTVPSGRRLPWVFAFLWCTFPGNRPFAFLYDVWPTSTFRFAFGLDTMAPFFGGCLAATALSHLRARPSGVRAWLPPALGLALAAAALVGGSSREAGFALACGLASLPALGWRGGWCIPTLLVLLHAAGVMGRIGTAPRQAPPDAEVLARRAGVLAALRTQQPGMPRVVAGKELRAGLVLPFELPNPDGYEPAAAPRRVSRLGQHLGLQYISWGGERLMGTWGQVAAAPGVARALGIGLVAVTPGQAKLLLAAGYRKIADLPDGDTALLQPAPARFHLVHAAAVVADEEAAFAAVTQPGFDPARVAILTGGPSPPLAPLPATAREEVRVVAETPEDIALEVTVASPALLVVRDTHFPGWEARVDGVATPILQANYAFRAVALSAGEHRVELRYRPLSFRIGIALSLVGLTAIAIVWRGRLGLIRLLGGS
jgi:hypothetical protein